MKKREDCLCAPVCNGGVGGNKEMQLTEDNAVTGGTAAECMTVIVGVRLDGESKELLTWALVKEAQPGDRVIALHVLDDSNHEGTASLISLVNAFDSVLAVYEGFCNLKQVDLKLKICRGPSVRKALVREVKTYSSAKLILGTSKTQHRVRSSASLAKFCAKSLPKSFSVFAVHNGKVVFQKDETQAVPANSQDHGKGRSYVQALHRSLSKSLKLPGNCDLGNGQCLQKSCSSLRSSVRSKKHSDRNGATQTSLETCDSSGIDNSLALVPFQASEDESTSSNSVIVCSVHGIRPGWSFLRRVFMPKYEHQEKATGKKTSVVKRLLGLPSTQSSAVIYPDHKLTSSVQSEDHTSDLDGESGAIVPMGSDIVCPLSPHNGAKNFPKELVGFHDKYSSTCRLYNYEELLTATNNFTSENLVGRGGSSQVYRGCLSDGNELAVKILKPSDEAVKEFASEIDIISTLNHKNIISILGFCYEDHNLALVYDFMHRGSLEENLHGDKKDTFAFGWRERYKVAVGVAEALDYLHNGCAEPVIHKDVKSSNILLSDDFEPQLSDFGLASRVQDASCQITIDDVAGTFGYLAPEYFMYGKVSDRVDVYAFGVVLLELLSGRKPIGGGEYPKSQESLIMWAKPVLQSGKVSQLLDPSLGSDYDHEHIGRMFLAATLCISRSTQVRPPIDLVVRLLQGEEEVVNWARQQISLSQEMDSMDGEDSPVSIQSHLNLAFKDLEQDSASVSSTEHVISIEDYLRGRWSRSSSFD